MSRWSMIWSFFSSFYLILILVTVYRNANGNLVRGGLGKIRRYHLSYTLSPRRKAMAKASKIHSHHLTAGAARGGGGMGLLAASVCRENRSSIGHTTSFFHFSIALPLSGPSFIQDRSFFRALDNKKEWQETAHNRPKPVTSPGKGDSLKKQHNVRCQKVLNELKTLQPNGATASASSINGINLLKATPPLVCFWWLCNVKY